MTSQIPTLNEIARRLIAEGWPAVLAFQEARDRLAMISSTDKPQSTPSDETT